MFRTKQPLKLLENRVSRIYSGGFLLDCFLDKENQMDSHFPENWLGSTVVAKMSGGSHKGIEGQSQILTSSGQKLNLRSFLQENASEILGDSHIKKYGANPGVLVKLLDSAIRLPIQVHPTQELAQKYFNSRFGKTEAWVVLGTRKIDGVDPYILLGFREGVSRETFAQMINEQDIKALEQCFHKISVREGDVFLVEAGIPHAIGQGCFMLEIQEPTDITLRAERNVGGIEIEEREAFQGLSLNDFLNCFKFETLSATDVLQKYRLNPHLIKKIPGHGQEQWLIRYSDTPYFAVRSINIESSWKMSGCESFHILLITSGKGCLSGSDFSQIIKRGDSFLVPNHLPYMIENQGDGILQAMTCWGPELNLV